MSSIKQPGKSARHWRLLSSHGFVLFYIGLRPDCTVEEISDALSLTPRSVWGTVGDLRRAGMLHVRREGRRHHYSVNYDAKVGVTLMPEGGVELRTMLRFLASRTLRVLDEADGHREESPVVQAGNAAAPRLR
jgi:DNA-binding transcriptional ArsR family regulator